MQGLAIRIALILILIVSGCTNTITPPPSPADPVTVYLLDHGRHPSLVLPDPAGNLTRYAYGQWRWYALGQTGFCQAVGALLVPSKAGLGRRQSDSPSIEAILSLAPAEQVYAIEVERAEAEQLRNELDALFEANRATLYVNEPYYLEFVHHPERYWILHNSNRVTADWLREMDCRVQGAEIASEWRVRPASSE